MTKTLLFLLALFLLGLGLSMLLQPARWWHLSDQGNRRLGRPWKRSWQWDLNRWGAGLVCLVLAGFFTWVAWQL